VREIRAAVCLGSRSASSGPSSGASAWGITEGRDGWSRDLPLRPGGKPPGCVAIYCWSSAVPMPPTALTDVGSITRAPGTVSIPVACAATPALVEAPGQVERHHLRTSPRGCRPAPRHVAPDRHDYGGRSGNVAVVECRTAGTAWAAPSRAGPGRWRVPSGRGRAVVLRIGGVEFVRPLRAVLTP